MARYYLQRALQALITVFAVVTVTFAIIRLLPGGPMDFLRAQLLQQARQGGGDINMGLINQQIQNYVGFNPDKPIYVQYVEYLTDLAHFNLGMSVWYDKSVSAILAEAIPWTVFVLSIGLLLNFAIGIGLGALMAYHEGDQFDSGSTVLSVIGTSVPYYVTAILLLYFLGYRLEWFPTGGRLPEGVDPSISIEFVMGALYHAFLPIVSLLTGAAALALSMRANSISVLGDDYIRVARLRGLSSRRIAFRHVVRNAILPLWTQLLISIAFLFGGSVILEQIFQYHGVGYYMFTAIESRDYPLLMGGFLVITIAVVIAVFIADLTYGLIDPRVTTGESQ